MIAELPPKSFTTTANSGLLSVFKNTCGICPAWHPGMGGVQPTISDFEAIWDTGATNSVITQAVIDACGLIPTGMARVHVVTGPSESETYLVNIALPNKVMFHSVRVTKGILPDADILIGMDIINQGDFAVTNLGGLTKFSFRYPSQTHIDFVADFRKQALAQKFQHGGIHPANRKKRPKPARGKKK